MTNYYSTLKEWIKKKATDFGFSEIDVATIQINPENQDKFRTWLLRGFHGKMEYLNRNLDLRFNPQLLQPETCSIICVMFPYLAQNTEQHKIRLKNPEHGYVSAYALGRDYHKVVKQNLEKLSQEINNYLKKDNLLHKYRVFCDSAPIMEVELARNAFLGWKGKNTLLINKNHGSMFFLGEIFTNLPLPAENLPVHKEHCGSCTKCIQICPTQAIIAPQLIDARRCISYLTIENPEPIPVEFRKAIGNRIYGCDDCQLFCPWNKFASLSQNPDFTPRNQLDSTTLLELFNWDENEFKQKMAGSAIYRVGYQSWQRNIAIGLGNAPYSLQIIDSLKNKLTTASPLVAEHIQWALDQQQAQIIETQS